jgi:4-hydroxybutyrate dehydrogenase
MCELIHNSLGGARRKRGHIMSTISYLTRIEFGEGLIERLAEFLDGLAIKRPLIATDKGMVATGLVQKVAEFTKRPVTIFDDTPANPTEAAVLEAHTFYKLHDCDGIIGLGGGSALDLAKGVRLLSGHEGPLAQYTLVAGGVARIHGRICPMIAIPTTSGTGSEVGRAAVIITAEGRKLGIISPHMLPSIALCDPELTYGLPPGLTAAGHRRQPAWMRSPIASKPTWPRPSIRLPTPLPWTVWRGVGSHWKQQCVMARTGKPATT